MNHLLARIGQRANVAARWLASAGVVGLLLLAIGTAADVLLRYGFAAPIRGFADVMPLAAAMSLAACMPYAITSRSHIRVELFGQHVLPRFARHLDAFGQLLTVGFFIVMAWQLFGFTTDAFNAGETMPVLRWVIWPWWAIATAFIGLAAGLGVVSLAHNPLDPT